MHCTCYKSWKGHRSPRMSVCRQWRLSPLGVVAQFPPSEFPMPSFLPLSSAMPSTFSFPSPLLLCTPALSPFSLPPLFNLGTWYSPGIFYIANLDVCTCILMCIIYVEINHWALCKTWIYCHYFCFGHLKHFDTVDRYALLNSVNG